MSSDDGGAWMQAPHTLAEETPTRKSQPAETVSYARRRAAEPTADGAGELVEISPTSSRAAASPASSPSSSSSSPAPAEPLSAAFDRAVAAKRALDLSSSSVPVTSRQPLASKRPDAEDAVPLVIDDDDDDDANDPFGKFVARGTAPGAHVARLVQRVGAASTSSAAAAATILLSDESEDVPVAARAGGKKNRVLDDDDTPVKKRKSAVGKSAGQAKAPRILDSDDEDGGREKKTAARVHDDEDDDDGVEVAAAADDNEDEEKTEEDEALDSNERELIEVESMVHQCESYTEALALGGGTGEAIKTIAQPKLFAVQLRNYQLVGLNWLALLHSKKLNGILADEMGLGKTAQTIAFLTHLLEVGDVGPHLVVAPTSTLHNWARELARFSPSLAATIYHGSIKERSETWQRVLTAQRKGAPLPHVVLTTYNILGSKFDKNFFKAFGWSYLVLDEAHAIKNPKSQRYQHLTRVAKRAQRRLLLTGTPLQNNLSELFALLNFLMPDVLQYEHLTRILNAPRLRHHDADAVDGEDIEAAYIRRAKKILNPFILRRLKLHVSSELPAKIDVVDACDMPELQRSAYAALLATSKRSLASALADADAAAADAVVLTIDDDDEPVLADEDADDDDGGGGGGARGKRKPAAKRKTAAAEAAELRSPLRRRQSGVGAGEKRGTVSNVLMQMRKMANHPLLCRNFFDDARVARVARALVDSGSDEFQGYPLHELIEDLKINSDFEIWRLCESYAGRALLAETPARSTLVEGAGKMRRLMQLLPPLVAARSKMLIFSQMTRMLDILEVVLQDARVAYVRLDGQTPINERMLLIDRFNNEPALSVFLLSTRAGGLGINLTAATKVFFYDFGFNPQVERQAEDRCHRLGQEQVVTVTRLVLQKSIDENILALATEKTRLNDMMLEEGKFVAAEEQSNQKIERSILQSILTNAE